jgi:hypothetical protein
MQAEEPYLSVIVTSRNDDHGGTLLRRMQAFATCLLQQCRRHRLSAELIVVEWNPPPDRPPLARALRWPQGPLPCPVRFIEVPAALHQRFRHAGALPLFQMIAKNVGLRRARGRYLLATNIDLLFNDDLMAFLAGRPLRPGALYRIDRTDVGSDVPPDGPVDAQLAYCRAHHLRANTKLGAIRLTPEGEADYGPVVLAEGVTLGEGWCGLATCPGLPPHAWATPGAELRARGPAAGPAVLGLDIEPGPCLGWRPFTLVLRDGTGRVVARGKTNGHRVLLRLPLGPAQDGLFRLDAEEVVAPADADPRTLLFCVSRCAWEPDWDGAVVPQGAVNFATRVGGRLEPDDIVAPDVGVRFGPNWSSVGRGDEGKHRWGRLEVDLVVDPRPGPDRVLVLDLQPGPGVGGEPFALQVFDAADRLVAQARVADRQAVALALPVPHGGPPQAYRLQAVGGGRPAANGDVLDFRLFGCRWQRDLFPLPAQASPGDFQNASAGPGGGLWRNDVAAPEVGVRFGRNWFGVSRDGAGTYRWAGHDALLVVEPRGPGRALLLDLEPGPGVGWKPFTLQVFDETDQLLDEAPVVCRHEVALLLPPGPPGEPRVYRLRAAGGGRQLPGGDVLDFRLFGCRQRSRGRTRIWLGRAALHIGRLLGLRLVQKLVRVTARALGRLHRGPGGTAPPPPREQPATPTPTIPAPPQLPPGQGVYRPPLLHTNACGDFTLMAREHWFDLRGYPEWHTYSLHIDSMLCYMAHYARLEEVVLPAPMRAYHIEHGLGSGVTPEGMDLLLARLSARGIPCPDFQEILAWAAYMAAVGRPAPVNDERWGLAGEVLPETVLPSAEAAGPGQVAA